MPRIDVDVKLDFKDVLFRPKRSSLKSRSEVDLRRTFTFRNSKQSYHGIPIIAANMDTTGTFEMAQVLSKDGGCSCPGDVAKAFGAGADFVMLGGMLAGHDQCAGEVIEKNGRKVKLFYGMSSDTAMKKHVGGVAEYRASEGRTVEVPYRGDVEATIRDILGGLRSTCTYVGAAKLKELSRRTTFIRVTQQASHMFT
ncbi:GMP reductase 1-like [Salvelinus fontinalis]|uniref:GMP reductase 1-like n=1 Tax=Salvelinus fontinalis TaxID=8038 RepID=UPI002486CC36|nr:GMP reductase 1-like [Salvelinus fontinalis]